MRKVLLMAMAREKSTRIQHKMTRPFGDTTLYDIYLKKVNEIAEMKHPFSNIILALCKDDKTLWNMSKSISPKVQLVERNSFSSGDAYLPSDVYHYLKDFDEEYVLWINACFPFLNPQTVIDATNFFIKNKELVSLTCVKEKLNWFWDFKTREPITIERATEGRTEKSLPIYESVHCFHINNVEDMMKRNIWWKLEKNDPYLYVVKDTTEFLDIDYETDLEIAEAVWYNKKRGNNIWK
jgi:CMP-N-acetylneuraminic acid synthetase